MSDELFQGVSRRSAVLQAIRDLFNDLGGAVPLRELADAAVARGVVPPEMIAACQQRGLTALCRQALKVETDDRLPFAKPMSDDGDDDHTRWGRLNLFTYDQAAALVLRESKAWVADRIKIERLRQWCLDRFGRAPDIPELREIEPA